MYISHKKTKRYAVYLLAAIMLFSSIAVFPITTVKADETAMVKGYVTNSETEEPIPDADVSIWNNDYNYWTYTDGDGYFEKSLEPGSYDVQISKQDYHDHYGSLEVADKEVKWYNVSLKAKPPENSVLKGFVKDKETEENIQGAHIDLWNNDDHYSNESDDNGYYEIQLRKGKYDLSAQKDGYKDYHKEGLNIGENDTVWFNITLEQKPPENSVLKGQITDQKTEEPLPNVRVEVNGDGWNETYTDNEGNYEMNTSEGNFRIEVREQRYRAFIKNIDIPENDTKILDISLKPEDSLIRGYIVDTNETPLEDASFFIGKGEIWNGSSTNDSGYFEINIAEGSYDLGVQKDGYRDHNDDLYVPDEKVLWYNVTLEKKPEPDAVVKGYVVNINEEPVKNANFNLWEEENYYAETNSSGYYEIEVVGDDYHVHVNADGYKDHNDELEIPGGETNWYNVTLEERPPENSYFKGYVTDNHGEPLKNADVDLENKDEDIRYHKQTDSEGYFELKISSGEYDADFYKDSYSHERYQFNIFDNDTVWYNVSLEELEMVWVRGYVTENATGDPIKKVWVNYEGEDASYHEKTNETGYYEMEVASEREYEIRIHFENQEENNYKRFEEKLYVVEDTWLNITLEDIPPYDVLLKGYVKDNDTGANLEAFIGTMNIEFDSDSGNQSEKDTGYYEVGAWSGLSVLMAMAEDYYRYFHVESLTEGEYWFNFSLHKEREVTSNLHGIVTDFEDEPVNDAMIQVVNQWTGIPIGDDDPAPYHAKTNQSGEYEVNVPIGDWFVLVGNDDDNAALEKVSISGDTKLDIQLPEPPQSDGMEITFDGWDNISYSQGEPFNMDMPSLFMRIMIDFNWGNMDETVDSTEASEFEDFLDYMIGRNGDGDGPEDMENTSDDFYVDDIYYDFVEESLSQSITNIEGDITSADLIMSDMNGELVSHETIPDAENHTILFNVSYDNNPGKMKINLPTDLILDNFSATDNFSIAGADTGMITIEFIGTENDDQWEMLQLYTILKNEPPVAEAGDEKNPNSGDPVLLNGSGNDPDGEIVLYEWDLNGDGTYELSSTESGQMSHTYANPGIYHPILRVTDDRGAVDTDGTTVIVNGLPTAEAGPEMGVFEVGNDVTFNGSGSKDTDPGDKIAKYEWDFDNDGTWDWSSQTSGITTHNYSQPGNYTPKLRVTDSKGAVDTDTTTIQVKPKDQMTPPNLKIESIDFKPLKPEEGDAVTITVLLRNSGEKIALNATIRIEVDGKEEKILEFGDIPGEDSADKSFKWVAKNEGKHTISINLTYQDGEDIVLRDIVVQASGDDGIPGFTALFSIAAVGGLALVLIRRKRLV